MIKNRTNNISNKNIIRYSLLCFLLNMINLKMRLSFYTIYILIIKINDSSNLIKEFITNWISIDKFIRIFY